jgi:hypothetical protein
MTIRLPWRGLTGVRGSPAQITWGVRFNTTAEASKFVGELATEVSGRMHKLGVRGRSVQLKLMRAVANAPETMRKGSVGHGVCDTYTRTVTLASFTRDAADIRCAHRAEAQIRPNAWCGVAFDVLGCLTCWCGVAFDVLGCLTCWCGVAFDVLGWWAPHGPQARGREDAE